jgi:hypothetical protein
MEKIREAFPLLLSSEVEQFVKKYRNPALINAGTPGNVPVDFPA